MSIEFQDVYINMGRESKFESKLAKRWTDIKMTHSFRSYEKVLLLGSFYDVKEEKRRRVNFSERLWEGYSETW